MKLPKGSHLQLLVLGSLVKEEASGRFLRGRLRAAGVRQTGPAFYQLMARMEDAGWVKGWYVKQIVSGQHVKERRYRLTAAGARALTEARSFYVEVFGADADALPETGAW